jgi:hypothetical protein
MAMKCDLPDEHDGEERPRAGREGARAAAQPIIGGSAPGTAPTIVASCERRFMGV